MGRLFFREKGAYLLRPIVDVDVVNTALDHVKVVTIVALRAVKEYNVLHNALFMNLRSN